MTPEALHELAVNCGACVMGDGPHHYLVTAEQLAAIVERVRAEPPQKVIIPPPPC